VCDDGTVLMDSTLILQNAEAQAAEALPALRRPAPHGDSTYSAQQR
jgi:hypothetical protein